MRPTEVVFDEYAGTGGGVVLPSIKAAPAPASMPTGFHLSRAGAQAYALEAAIIDLLDSAGTRRVLPATVRFVRHQGMVVCAIYTKERKLGFGCVRGESSGTFVPSPEWRSTLLAELEEATGWRDLDDSGLPAIAS